MRPCPPQCCVPWRCKYGSERVISIAPACFARECFDNDTRDLVVFFSASSATCLFSGASVAANHHCVYRCWPIDPLSPRCVLGDHYDSKIVLTMLENMLGTKSWYTKVSPWVFAHYRNRADHCLRPPGCSGWVYANRMYHRVVRGYKSTSRMSRILMTPRCFARALKSIPRVACAKRTSRVDKRSPRIYEVSPTSSS